MKARFLPPAQRELAATVRYDNIQRHRLGDEFRDEARATIQRILDFPLAWHLLGGDIRRCRMRRFPHGIIYEPWLERGEIIIIAVAGLQQEPEYWRSRV